MVTAHHVAVTFTGGRYPHVPSCSCGWRTWGFLTNHAAQVVADDHKEFRMRLHACAGCGIELDGDDPNERCEECAS